jgi:hypothetical protein
VTLGRFIALAAIVVAGVFLITRAAAASSSSVDADALASWAAGKPAHVRELGRGFIGGQAFIGGDEMLLSHETILLVRRGGGAGVFALLHEAAHLRQHSGDYGTPIEFELAADRWAMAHVRAAFRRFWPGMSRRRVELEYRSAAAAPHYHDNREGT